MLLVDYGEVISLPHPRSSIEAMATMLDLGSEAFVERYWRERPEYDRGAAPEAYWSAVAGETISEPLLARLMKVDAASWLHLNAETLAVLDRAADEGFALALFSNAPASIASEIDALPELARFEQRLFSAHLGLIKPEPNAFEAALAQLGRTTDQVLFIDDRAVNVAAAQALGIRALEFGSAEQLDALLP